MTKSRESDCPPILIVHSALTEAVTAAACQQSLGSEAANGYLLLNCTKFRLPAGESLLG